jgi:hypothetical protein
LKRVTVTITDTLAAELRQAAQSSLEFAAVLVAGISETETELRFLGRELWQAPETSYSERTPEGLTLTPDAYMRALSRAEILGAAAVFVHSHPMGRPVRSLRDEGVDAQLRPLFQIRTGSPFYGALVVSVGTELQFSGRAWRNDDDLGPITFMREVGSAFRFSTAYDSGRTTSTEAFERQVRAFGADMQDILAELHVGVVGLGGTGSAVVEQLARLGLGRLTLVDDDVVTVTNITRIHGSVVSDVGRSKTAVASAGVELIGLRTRTNVVEGKATTRVAMDALRDCDIVFGCTDDHVGRANLARLTTWCLIPLIDSGVMIQTQNDSIEIWCRVTTTTPESPCLICWRVVDQARMRVEQLPKSERDGLRREGYVPDLGLPDPSVVTYTTLTASFAVSEMINRLLGMVGNRGQQLMFRADHPDIHVSTRTAEPGHWCTKASNVGAGAAEPFLGRLAWS